MFTELIDTLRCPNEHEDSWLVASSTRTGQRHIIDGKLGCPVCKASFDITDGEVMFGAPLALRSAIVMGDEAAFTLAAQLHLVEAPQPILLVGHWSRAVAPLRRLVPAVTMFVGDASTVLPLDERVSVLRLPASRFPLASGVLRGLALDAAHADARWLDDAARVVRVQGRLVVPLAASLDAGAWRVIAQDDDVTVAERLPSAGAPVTLRRAPSTPLLG